MPHKPVNFIEMSPACGAIIEDLDLSKGLTNQQFVEIYNAVVDRVVLVFRNQTITPEQHIAFARRFGKPQAAAASGFEKNKDYPEIDNLDYDAEHPPHVTRDLWHTDFAGRERPAWGTVIFAREIPPKGGDTIWVNSVAAYEGLSERMRVHIEGLWAYHDSYKPYGEHVRPEMWVDEGKSLGKLNSERSNYRPALHPVVRTHPDTGK